MSAQRPPAGWYDDGSGSGTMRYWDGQGWTQHTHRAATPPPPPAGPAPTAPAAPAAPAPPRRRGRGPLIALLVSAGAVVALVIAGVFAWGPIMAALNPKVPLSDADFYQDAVESARDSIQEPVTPLAYPDVDGIRVSPGYTAAAAQYVEDFLANYGAEEMLFDSADEAEEYAYSVAYPEITGLEFVLYDGGAGTELATTGFPQDPSIVALEQQIAAMPVAPGADGTYWETAAAMGALLGSTITQDLSLSDCLTLDITVEPSAFFCPSPDNWDNVFFTPEGASTAATPKLVAIMKHELAHKLIAVQCTGAFDFLEADWNDQYGEGVTNSYAIMYLGADPALLSYQDDYAVNDVTNAKAQAIHESDLACFDDGVLPDPS